MKKDCGGKTITLGEIGKQVDDFGRKAIFKVEWYQKRDFMETPKLEQLQNPISLRFFVLLQFLVSTKAGCIQAVDMVCTSNLCQKEICFVLLLVQFCRESKDLKNI